MLKKLMNYLDQSTSSYHAVELLRKELLEKGYMELDESLKMDKNSKNYFFIKNDTSLVAFQVGNHLKDDFGFMITATHTDFPQFKLKPNCIVENGKYIQLNTEPYGAMILSTWLDRPLGISGRVYCKENGKIVKKLVAKENMLFIPNLSIHLNREQNLPLNPQVHLLPIVSNTKKLELKDIVGFDNILSHDLYLYNTQKSVIVGADSNFLMSQKIDNLESTYICFKSFIETKASANINVFACFDNEEVGSRSVNGADSTLLSSILEKIALVFGNNNFNTTLKNSFIVSCDNAHSYLPNYPAVFDQTNKVHVNEGVVIKYNANRNYSTDGFSSAIFKAILEKNAVKYQEFTNRSDIKGGGTLGSISLSHVSINSIDIGLPQFAMHSAYESCGVLDIEELYKAMKSFYESKINFIDKNNLEIV